MNPASFGGSNGFGITKVYFGLMDKLRLPRTQKRNAWNQYLNEFESLRQTSSIWSIGAAFIWE